MRAEMPTFTKMRVSGLGRSVFVFVVCVAPLLAQDWLSVGVKGGVPLSDAFADRTFTNQILIPNPFSVSLFQLQTTRVNSGSRGFVLGPTVEVQFPLGLAVEADALYRSMNAKSQTQTS